MKLDRRRIRQALIGALVSGALLAAVLSQLDLDDALARVRGADAGLLGWAALCSLLVLVARTLRFRALVTRAGVGPVMASTAAQNAINRVAPFKLGELSLPFLLHRAAGEPPARTLVMLALVRLVEIWLLCLLLVAGIALWFGGREWQQMAVVGGVAAVATGLLLTFRWWSGAALRVAERVGRRVGLDRFAAFDRVVQKLGEALDGGAGLSSGQKAAVVGGTLAVMGLQYTLYGLLIASVGVEVHPLQVAVGYTLAQVAGAVPVLSVGNLGTHETGWTLGFVWVGLALEDAVLTGIYTQLVTLGFAVVFAGPAALYFSTRRVEPRAELTRSEPDT